MHFGEYELSPSLISLSPLPSAHPEAFQRLFDWNAPLPMFTHPKASVEYLMPDYYPRQTPRLVSCYALFK